MDPQHHRADRTRLTLLPVAGDRICLYDGIFDDTHDHGTVLDVRVREDGNVQVNVRFDDDPPDTDTGWCDLHVFRLKCPTRALNTRGNHPRLTER
jgi:hypothetical protein